MTSSGAEPDRHDDPLLESCLEEILGGQTPPDLKSEIMRRMHGGKEGHVVPPPFQPNTAEVQRPVIQPLTRSSNGRIAQSRAANRVRLHRYAWMMSTGVVVCLLAFAIYFASSQSDDVALPPPADAPPQIPTPQAQQPLPDETQPAEQVAPASTENDPPSEPPVDNEPTQPLEVSPVEVADVPMSDDQVVELVNQHIQERWQLADVQPTGPIDDTEWCQRVFQRLFGRSMSDDELRNYERWQTADKRRDLLDFLFKSERYHKEFAVHWGELWSNRLLARANPRGAKTMQRGLARYLQSQLEENRKHDEWVSALITAEGSNMLSEPDHNGATNFLLGLRDKDGVLPTTEVCRVLLGQRVQCAQCHNDGQAGLSQEQFWEMTAYFRQMEFIGYGPGRARLAHQETADTVRFQGPDGQWQEVEPRFFADTEGGRPVLNHRREELARLITNSELFARATVNRIWAHFLGYGFTSPVDDMGHRNPASHPELLDQLALIFATEDFDTQRLIRWIVLSEPFNRSQVLAVGDKSDIPEISFVALFSRYYHRSPLFTTPHDALVSLGDGKADRLATMLSESVLGRKQDAFDDDEGRREASGNDGTGQVGLASQLNIGQLRLARSLAKSSMSTEEKLRHVFLAVMARFPSSPEMRQASQIYASAEADPIQAMENLIWALTRTQEFVDEH